MPKELKYLLQVRDTGLPWRTVWSGPGQTVACEAARKLAAETRLVEGWDISVPIHPYVRVMQAGKVVYQVTPESRRSVA